MTRWQVGWARSVSLDPSLEREFEERVADSSTLAFRVALGVLRHREDAEDVAQDAFLRAHRAFGSLRDRDRFRAWLVRTAFRLALDRLRGEKRRSRREDAVGRSRRRSGRSRSRTRRRGPRCGCAWARRWTRCPRSCGS